MDLSRFTIIISKSHRNIFPVVDRGNKFIGVVSLDSVRNYMFRPEIYHKYTVGMFMKEPPAIVSINDPLNLVTKKFEDTNAWNLPVIDENGKYLGFISRSGMFQSYRQTLKDFSQD